MTKTEAITTAIKYIRRNGYEIIERNPTDNIDLVAWERKLDKMIFCVVKWHRETIKQARTFATIKQRVEYRKAVNRWCRENKWKNTNIRVDALHICGDERPFVDHVQDVKIK